MPESSELLWIVAGALLVLALLAAVVRRYWRERRAAIESGQPPAKATLRFASSVLALAATWSICSAAAWWNPWWLLAAVVVAGAAVTCWILAERQPDPMARPSLWGTSPPTERRLLQRQQQAVANLLDSEWDPIGVYLDDERPVPGEYEPFAWEVLAHLRRGDSETDIAALLTTIRARDIGLGPGPQDARAARALVEWYRGA